MVVSISPRAKVIGDSSWRLARRSSVLKMMPFLVGVNKPGQEEVTECRALNKVADEAAGDASKAQHTYYNFDAIRRHETTVASRVRNDFKRLHLAAVDHMTQFPVILQLCSTWLCQLCKNY